VFGYKVHVKTDLGFGFVSKVEATPASVHNSRVDLSESGRVVYWRARWWYSRKSRSSMSSPRLMSFSSISFQAMILRDYSSTMF
jgi:hypothetical protein